MTPCALGARFPDWPSHLNAVVNAARARPFAWTGHNCAAFAFDVVEAITGVRCHDRFAGLMRSAASARRAAREMDLHVDAIVGADRRIPPAFAQRGDCVLIDTDTGKVLAIVIDHRIAAQGPAGLVLIDSARILRAWAV